MVVFGGGSAFLLSLRSSRAKRCATGPLRLAFARPPHPSQTLPVTLVAARLRDDRPPSYLVVLYAHSGLCLS